MPVPRPIPTPRPYISQNTQSAAEPKPGLSPTMLPKEQGGNSSQKKWNNNRNTKIIRKVLFYRIVRKWIEKVKKAYLKIRYRYGNKLEVSSKKMHQLGKHFKKHGRKMGYKGKKEY